MFIHDSCFSWQYRSDTFLEHVSFSRLFLKQHWSRVKISTVGSSYSLRVRAQIKFVRNLFRLVDAKHHVPAGRGVEMICSRGSVFRQPASCHAYAFWPAARTSRHLQPPEAPRVLASVAWHSAGPFAPLAFASAASSHRPP